jgi:hypothetical protein
MGRSVCLYLQTQRGALLNFCGPKTGTPCRFDLKPTAQRTDRGFGPCLARAGVGVNRRARAEKVRLPSGICSTPHAGSTVCACVRACVLGQGGAVDQWVSGGRRSHGGAEARRKQREETTTRHKGNWRVPCFCLCVNPSL